MRLFVIAYYVMYVLSGGFRHYTFDLAFSQTIVSAAIIPSPFGIVIGQHLLTVLALMLVAFPYRKYLHLGFFIILQLLDSYFQNHVGFMSCFILPHLIPLFFFLFLQNSHTKSRLKIVAYIGVLTIATGFLVAFVGKVSSGWLNPSDAVVQHYMIEFSLGYQIPSIMAEWLLANLNDFLWKSMDYMVLVFQLSFALVFFNWRWFIPISFFAVIFHIGIFLTLGIAVVFYNYILFYSLILHFSHVKGTLNSDKHNVWAQWPGVICALLLSVVYVSSGFNIHFFNTALPVNLYVYVDYIYTSLCVGLYVIVLWQIRQSLGAQSSSLVRPTKS